ncbi:hypothetical protein FRC11_013880, partial [Ceratobasidium sp. 423]
MFDFIAQTAFSLPMRSKDLPRAKDPNKKFVDQVVWMWEFVGKILPKDQLRVKFQAIVPELRKYIAYALRWAYMGDDVGTRWQRFRLMSQPI